MTTTPDNLTANTTESSEAKKQKRLANLKPWKPGQSGNPSGRPKRNPISDALREIMEEIDPRTKKLIARRLADALVKKALAGDVKAAALIGDRVEGKVPIRVAGHDGGPIKTELTDAERRARILALAQSAQASPEESQ